MLDLISYDVLTTLVFCQVKLSYEFSFKGYHRHCTLRFDFVSIIMLFIGLIITLKIK
jgi:hypothetical protein